MSPVDILGRYWVQSYAWAVQDAPATPFVAITGHAADALGASNQYGDSPLENLAFMTGYLGYPCDAVYVTAVIDIAGVLALNATDPIPDIDTIIDNPETRPAVMSWTHSVPTRETALHMLVQTIGDDGHIVWEPADPGDDGGIFNGLIHAAHDFESIAPQDGEADARRSARGIVAYDNGHGYTANFYSPGSMLGSAKEAAGSTPD